MWDLAPPALLAVFAWWFSTGLILFLDRLPARTFPWSMAGATLVLAAGFHGLWRSADDASVWGACVAFLSSVGVWAWLETSFLMGYVTGPRRIPPPPGAAGWRLFRLAVQTVIHHELAVLAAAIAVAWLTVGHPNPYGLWAFLAIWAMKLSAKLNIHWGARNLGEHLLPDHLAYLRGYFTRRAMNPLFPVSIAAAAGAAAWFAAQAVAPEAAPFQAAGSVMVAALFCLAAFEHVLLFIPLPAGAAWAMGFAPAVAREPGSDHPSPAAPQSRLLGAPRRTRPFLDVEPRLPAARRSP
ncbi:putative photosynthetic complex assembly protein PuhE [Alsobacter sp. KACC 23698]|uniref:Photosynthetic complex assembly protein PuhE n=1 Tax=Alsobacter sp. KACC 23698 TaxID=3149229 RepID=A0AAU7JDP8_9HYPH